MQHKPVAAATIAVVILALTSILVFRHARRPDNGVATANLSLTATGPDSMANVKDGMWTMPDPSELETRSTVLGEISTGGSDSDARASIPKIEHSWCSIGGLCTPDLYPPIEEILESAEFNPHAKHLHNEELVGLSGLLAELRPQLESRIAEAQLQLSEAVTWKIELGMDKNKAIDYWHPDLGCANVKRADREGKEYMVEVRPGEFPPLDIACEAARNEALAGERQIQLYLGGVN
jgi:hypothetical protein